MDYVSKLQQASALIWCRLLARQEFLSSLMFSPRRVRRSVERVEGSEGFPPPASGNWSALSGLFADLNPSDDGSSGFQPESSGRSEWMLNRDENGSTGSQLGSNIRSEWILNHGKNWRAGFQSDSKAAKAHSLRRQYLRASLLRKANPCSRRFRPSAGA